MRKTYKITNIVLVFIFIGLFLWQNIAFCSSGRKLSLRVPSQIDYNRIEEILKYEEIRFAVKKDAQAVSKANNMAWKGNKALQVTREIVASGIERDSQSYIIYDTPEEGVTGVLRTARIKTRGNLAILNPKALWNRLVQGSPEKDSDTLICYAIGVIPGARGEKGGSVAIKLIMKAREVASRYRLKFVLTLSPTPRFEEFKARYGKILKKKLIPEELWIYAYLVSVEHGGPFPYLDIVKEYGYISIQEYIRITGKRLYCPTEGFHVIGCGAEIGSVLKNSRPDCEYGVIYFSANPEVHSMGIEKEILEILQRYREATGLAANLSNILARKDL